MCCIHAAFPLFYCLVQFEFEFLEFEFELNFLVFFSKMQKNLSFPLSPLSVHPVFPSFPFPFSPLFSARPSFIFPFLSAQPETRLLSLPTDRRAPPVGPVLFLRLKRDSSSGSPGRAHPTAPCRDPHAEAVRSGLYVVLGLFCLVVMSLCCGAGEGSCVF